MLIVEDKCWKSREDEISGGKVDLGGKSSFEIEDGERNVITGEESKFDEGRGMFVTFSCHL